MNNTAARTRPRRWIAAEIESLDPATDYEAIWRLTSSYGLNDFALNLVYAHRSPTSTYHRTDLSRCGTAATARTSSAPCSASRTPSATT